MDAGTLLDLDGRELAAHLRRDADLGRAHDADDRRGLAARPQNVCASARGDENETKRNNTSPAASHACRLRFTRERRNRSEREIDNGLGPEAAPVARHLPQGCAQLINAHHAVDGQIRREYVARGEDRLGDCFARPGKARQEELRKAGSEEDERRRLRTFEPGAHCLAHEARCQHENRGQREQLQGLAEGGEAVEPRQHDEIERERGQIDGEVGDAASEHAGERRRRWHLAAHRTSASLSQSAASAAGSARMPRARHSLHSHRPG